MSGLLDLPEEVLRLVVLYSDQLYPWLLVAKSTCRIAGETIYSQGVQAWEKPPPLLALLKGAGNTASAEEGLFSNRLKIHFLAQTRRLQYGEPVRLHALSHLRTCLRAIPPELVVFPRLDSLILSNHGPPTTHPLASMLSEIDTRLVNMSRARNLCFVAQDWCHSSPFPQDGIIPHNHRLESVTIHVNDLTAHPTVLGGSKRYKIPFGLDIGIASTDITERVRWIATCIASQPQADWTVENAAQIKTGPNSITCYEPITARLLKEGVRKQFRQNVTETFPPLYSIGPRRCEACDKWTRGMRARLRMRVRHQSPHELWSWLCLLVLHRFVHISTR